MGDRDQENEKDTLKRCLCGVMNQENSARKGSLYCKIVQIKTYEIVYCASKERIKVNNYLLGEVSALPKPDPHHIILLYNEVTV